MGVRMAIKEIKSLAVILCVFCSFCWANDSRFREIYDSYNDADGRVLVVAHRADVKNAPENSILAINNAINNGVDIVEVDVRQTSDGHFILMHDSSVDRTTNGTGLVEEMSLAQIKNLYLKMPDGTLTDYRVPTLNEAMLAVKGSCMVNLDNAHNTVHKASQVLEILKETDTVDHAIFKSTYSPDTINGILESLDTDIMYMPMICCYGTDTPSTYDIMLNLSSYNTRVRSAEIVFDDDTHPVMGSEFVNNMRKRGIRFFVNTMSDSLCGGHGEPSNGEDPAESWGWLFERGVNMIQTDEPQALVDYVATFDYCGSLLNPYPIGDINYDCLVDIYDLAILADNWMFSYEIAK